MMDIVAGLFCTHHKLYRPLSYLYSHPNGRGYFSQTVMHMDTHWDESDHGSGDPSLHS